LSRWRRWPPASPSVTVMFCDLVDSTGFAAKLDAEEWRDLVGAYNDAASAAVVEMSGKVAKKSPRFSLRGAKTVPGTVREM
jgi:class 3 adenylate cyclase